MKKLLKRIQCFFLGCDYKVDAEVMNDWFDAHWDINDIAITPEPPFTVLICKCCGRTTIK